MMPKRFARTERRGDLGAAAQAAIRGGLVLVAAGCFGLTRTWLPSIEGTVPASKIVFARVTLLTATVLCLAAAAAWPRLREVVDRILDRLGRGDDGALHRSPSPAPIENRLFVAYLIALFVVTLALALRSPRALEIVAVEDGPLESASAIFFLAAAAIQLVLAWRHPRPRGLRPSLILLGAIFLFVGMEEISWGQRLLGFRTPESIGELNMQGEFTLHNQWSTTFNELIGLSVVVVILVVLPVLHATRPRIRRALDGLGWPTAPLRAAKAMVATMVAWAVVGISLGTFGFGRYSWYGIKRNADDEFLEFFLAFLFFTLSAGRWRLDSPSESAAGAAAGGEDGSEDDDHPA